MHQQKRIIAAIYAVLLIVSSSASGFDHSRALVNKCLRSIPKVHSLYNDLTLNQNSQNPTQPLGVKTEIPNKDANNPSLKSENELAVLLSELGYQVVQNPWASSREHKTLFRRLSLIESLSPSRKADYIIEGKIFDHYRPSDYGDLITTSGRIYEKTIIKKQTHRVIIDLRENNAFNNREWSLKDLQDMILRMQRPEVWEVLVVSKDSGELKLTTVYPSLVEH